VIGRDTLSLLDGMRASVNRQVDGVAQSVVTSWAHAWNDIQIEWVLALEELTDGATTWPSQAQILRAQRAQNAMKATRDVLRQLSRELPIVVSGDLPNLTHDAVLWEARLTASQYPPQAGSTAAITSSFKEVNPRAIDAIVRRTMQQITALSYPIQAQATQAIRTELIRGVAIGDNPRRAASRMLNRVDGAFNGGRNRALVIARTEMLDAHRQAAAQHDRANANVLQGWQWSAQLDHRTCASCWSQHGNTFPVETPGPWDHQQGRCARLPVTRSWADLGFPGIQEPASLLPDSRTTFNALPEEDRLRIMGRARLDKLDQGEVSWSQLSTKRSTPGWRDSYAPTPVKDL
jgi:SPP1 gp7 family putative phage head morphogenesis protein